MRDGKNEYLVEVKEKQANPDLAEDREEAFGKGEVFKISESLKTKTILQNVVNNGRRQIKSYVTDDSIFRVVWVHCTGLAYDSTREQTICGLYGSVDLVDHSSEEAIMRTCYYFGNSHFFKYSDSIDAVMVSGRKGETALCLNNYSPRYEQLKESALVQTMPDGVRDPIKEEAEGEAFLVDGEVNRGKPEEVLNSLRTKYKTEELNVMHMRQMEVQMAIPDKNE